MVKVRHKAVASVRSQVRQSHDCEWALQESSQVWAQCLQAVLQRTLRKARDNQSRWWDSQSQGCWPPPSSWPDTPSVWVWRTCPPMLWCQTTERNIPCGILQSILGFLQRSSGSVSSKLHNQRRPAKLQRKPCCEFLEGKLQSIHPCILNWKRWWQMVISMRGPCQPVMAAFSMRPVQGMRIGVRLPPLSL